LGLGNMSQLFEFVRAKPFTTRPNGHASA
jgi:hypothetical protein